jgi:hypothetical protein
MSLRLPNCLILCACALLSFTCTSKVFAVASNLNTFPGDSYRGGETGDPVIEIDDDFQNNFTILNNPFSSDDDKKSKDGSNQDLNQGSELDTNKKSLSDKIRRFKDKKSQETVSRGSSEAQADFTKNIDDSETNESVLTESKPSESDVDLIESETGVFNAFNESTIDENLAKKAQKMKELKGYKPYVDIEAENLTYNDEQTLYKAYGKAVATFPERDITLYADEIIFDSAKEVIEAKGNLKLVQGETVVYGSFISLDTAEKTYDMDEPRIYNPEIRLKARNSYSVPPKKKKDDTNGSIVFEDGYLAVDKPIGIFVPGNSTQTRYSRNIRRYYQNRELRWRDLPDRSRLKYSAEKVIYNTKERINNLHIHGARVWVNDDLSVPSPVAINTTVGDAAKTQFMGPVIGNRERVGGFALGPRYYKSINDFTLAIAPILQIGNGPSFGGGAIVSLNNPNDRTALMIGYGTLENRMIMNLHQQLPWGFEANALVNQISDSLNFGSSQVGQMYELAHRFRLKSWLFDERGAVFRTSASFAADNAELFSDQRLEDLRKNRGDRGFTGEEEESGFRFEEAVSFYSRPFYRFGNEAYNTSLRIREDGAIRLYGSGDVFALNRIGPALETRLGGLIFEFDYLYTYTAGESPFLFDQFIDGTNALVFDGDYAINDFISIGTFLNYNIDDNRISRNQLRTELGYEDLKLRLSYDTVRNQIGIGLNMMFGEPVQFKQLETKI